ncbi:hypothetical protein PTTW11_01638 [Pyrenophora teres f. teres]|uniref:Uncharacterized protein n=1 Tax=Pyrenophora teres f. teres TaxID=97479 RepID=A0A6S6V8Y5_9PLEO|nr:hypothetical protein PTTW11_01638 [Pyrenophora teres f. teres]
MRLVFLAALAAVPATIVAQDMTYTATHCTLHFGYYPIPTGTAGNAAVPTWYQYLTTMSLTSVTTEIRQTVTATANATTQMNMLTTTATVFTTTTSTPAAVVVPALAGFIPMMVGNAPNATPTPIPRIKRHSLSEDNSLQLRKRQTCPNCSGGFWSSRNGTTSSLNRKFIFRVDCLVYETINRTQTMTVMGLPTTVYQAEATALASSTLTVSVTITVTEVLPRATEYAACGVNNVVNRIRGINGKMLMFDRVIYRPAEGFPNEDELVINMTSAAGCCVACQTTPNCAGSFFAPSDLECHLRLTQPPAALPTILASPIYPSGVAYPSGAVYSSGIVFPPGVFPSGTVLPSGTGAPYTITNNTLARRCLLDSPQPSSLPNLTLPAVSDAPYPFLNATYPSSFPTLYPSASGIFPTVTSPSGISAPMSTSGPVKNSNATCGRGSLSLYLGTIQGQEDFPEQYALSFSNGPCGRLSVWPVPVDDLEENWWLD